MEQFLFDESLNEQREGADGDVALDFGIGPVECRSDFEDGFDGTEVGFNDILLAIGGDGAGGCHVELMVPYDSSSADDAQRMRQLEEQAVARLLDAGAFFSRPYGTADRVFAKNPANLQLIGQVKSLFDPNRVLHRGKWGL